MGGDGGGSHVDGFKEDGWEECVHLAGPSFLEQAGLGVPAGTLQEKTVHSHTRWWGLRERGEGEGFSRTGMRVKFGRGVQCEQLG